MYQLGPQSKNYDPALSKKYLLEENQTKDMFQLFLYRKHIILVALSDQFFKLSIFQFQFLLMVLIVRVGNLREIIEKPYDEGLEAQMKC
jgi:hypothetical protein